MLKINKINVNIGLIEILKDVSLDLEKGQMVGLIGRNGAGKTTLLRAIMGILPIKSGESSNFNGNFRYIFQSFVVYSLNDFERSASWLFKTSLV